MNWAKIEEVVYSECDNPHSFLGAHIVGNNTLIQCFFPDAEGVVLKYATAAGRKKITFQDAVMECADEAGFFALLLPGKEAYEYKYLITFKDGHTEEALDPYNYEPLITKKDTDKFKNGIHYTIYDKLGAHFTTVNGEKGTAFAVWAPNALRISVVGDFNHWDGRIHQMRRLWDSGIFEIFIPGVQPFNCYKFEIKLKNGLTYLKADPYAQFSQLRPDTASVIAEEDDFVWEDSEFIANREKFQNYGQPMSVYELYLGSFLAKKYEDRYPNYRDIAGELIAYVKEMKYTHVEFMPVMEHPLDNSWGYQVIGYYSPTARYGKPKDFMYLINELHKAGIGVILDWVPAHFPRDAYGLSNFDGTCLYEHLDPRQGWHPHWGTLLYNYGRPEVSNYLLANGLYWVEKFHADGIRMDAVASMLYLDYGKNDGEWVANMYGGKENLEAIEFMKHFNSILKKRNPGALSIAEDSTSFPMITGDLDHNGLGFDLKWNMGFMNDYLNYIKYDPYFRSYHHGELTFSMIYAYSERFMLVFSHDEVVHGKSTLIGKMPGSREQKFQNLRLTYSYMMMHPGKKLLFMGQDLGEFDEWNENRSIQWHLKDVPEHEGIRLLVKDLNNLYCTKKALHELDHSPEGFEWINNISANDSYISFARKGEKKEDTLVIIANFSGVAKAITTGVPYAGKYKEIFNSDAAIYGGTNLCNPRMKPAKEKEWDDRPYSVTMSLAPCSLCVLQYVPFSEQESGKKKKNK